MKPSNYKHVHIFNKINNNTNILNSFRKDKFVINVMEHVSYNFAVQYINELNSLYFDYSNSLPWNKIIQNDNIGSPELFNFSDELCLFNLNSYDLSCNTIRYLFNAVDITHKLFHNQNSLKIIEVGAGYGGLCKILFDIHSNNISEYIIIDLPETLLLIKSFLEKFGYNKNIKFISCFDYKKHIKLFNQYFIISNYGISEFHHDIMNDYVNSIVLKSKGFYLIWNNKFIPDNLFNLKNISIKPEIPLTGPFNKIIIKNN